jgi:agmatinase
MDLKDVDVAMLGVPLDQGTTNRSGTRMGPRAIREASQIYGSIIQLFKEVYDIELERTTLKDLKIIDYGDVPIIPTLTKVNRKLTREFI